MRHALGQVVERLRLRPRLCLCTRTRLRRGAEGRLEDGVVLRRGGGGVRPCVPVCERATCVRTCVRACVRVCVRLGRMCVWRGCLRRPQPERKVLQQLRVLRVGVHPVVLGVRERHHLALAAVWQRAREWRPLVLRLVTRVTKRQRQGVELHVEPIGLLLTPRLARVRVDVRCGLRHRHCRHAATPRPKSLESPKFRAKNAILF